MALYIPHSIFHLARLLYVRPETFGPYYVSARHRMYLKCLEKFPKWVRRTERRKTIYTNMTANNFRGTARQCVHLNPVGSYLWGLPTDTEQTLHHSIYDACQTIRICPGTLLGRNSP